MCIIRIYVIRFEHFLRGGLEMFHDVLLNLRKVFRALEIKFVHRSTPVFVGVSSFFT